LSAIVLAIERIPSPTLILPLPLGGGGHRRRLFSLLLLEGEDIGGRDSFPPLQKRERI